MNCVVNVKMKQTIEERKSVEAPRRLGATSRAPVDLPPDVDDVLVELLAQAVVANIKRCAPVMANSPGGFGSKSESRRQITPLGKES